MLKQTCLVVGFSLILLSTAIAIDDLGRDSKEKEIEVALNRFLTAFENLDWQNFQKSFHADVTVFFPTPEPQYRFDRREAVEKQFQKVFSEIRSGAKSGPPYHRLIPKNLRIEMLSENDAIVTFELENEERIARRSIVFTKTDGVWLIRHLHASNVAK